MRKWVWGLGALTGCMVQTTAAPPAVTSLDQRVAALEQKVGGGSGTIAGVPTGTVVAFAGMSPPDGWVLCDGSMVDGTDPKYQNLYTVIGNAYGGDGSTKFKLPDLVGRTTIGAGTYTDPDMSFGTVPRKLGTGGGGAVHTLDFDMLPKHTHTIRITAGSGEDVDPSIQTCVARASGNCTTENDIIDESVLGTVPGQGLSSSPQIAYDTMPPYTVVNYIIKL